MKTIAFAAFIGATAAMSEIESAFLGYITQYGKSYSSLPEYETRLRHFAQKHSEITAHNISGANFKLGHNHMSDWSAEEYKAILTYKPEMSYEGENFIKHSFDAVEPKDWREDGAVNEVQDQAACGSCWTFSTMASFEGAHFIASGNLEKFAEQQLVDCVRTCHGCNGGNVSLAVTHLKRHDAMLETEYAYTAKDGTCREANTTGVRASEVVNVTQQSGEAMKAALMHAPLSVAIQADQAVFQHYQSGIFDSVSCGVQLDHATNVVGWGEENGIEYFIMRNSWSKSWGESGYMRILIAEGAGICGIQSLPQYVIAKN
jgi:C1A family cysteine protease